MNTTGPVKLSVIIPAYNEETFIEEVIERVRSVSLPEGVSREMVVVNDGSTDGTRGILNRLPQSEDLKILHHPENQGKAAAVKTGFKEASGDIFLIQDADLELDPQEYPVLLRPILSRRAEIVFGSRFKGSIQNMPILNRLANAFSTLVTNLLYGGKLSDMNTCYKMFRPSVLSSIEITSRHFAFDAEITAKFLRLGYTIEEVPVSYVGRSRADGKKMKWPRALEVFWNLLKYRFLPLEASKTYEPALEVRPAPVLTEVLEEVS